MEGEPTISFRAIGIVKRDDGLEPDDFNSVAQLSRIFDAFDEKNIIKMTPAAWSKYERLLDE